MPQPKKTNRKSDRPYNAKANLSVLFGDDEPATSPQTVKIEAIVLPASQPRRYFDPQKIITANSIGQSSWHLRKSPGETAQKPRRFI